jgi:hypothetical protein
MAYGPSTFLQYSLSDRTLLTHARCWQNAEFVKTAAGEKPWKGCVCLPLRFELLST